MAENPVQARVGALRRLARRRAAGPLERALQKSNSETISRAVTHLTWADTRFIMEFVSDDQGGEVLLSMDDDRFEHILESLETDKVMGWMDYLEPDDAADLIARFPPELQSQALQQMEAEDREDVEDLLAYPEDTAGGIMSPVAFLLNEDTTCREAIEALQEQGDVEMVFYLYLVNESDQLTGVTSLRQLLLNPPSKPLKELANPDVITVTPDTDQEEVARMAAHYDLLAVPVCDDTRKFLGIVTIDDVLDVVQEEAAEDMMKMAGVGEAYDPQGRSVLKAAQQRLTWLLVTAVGGLGLARVIMGFEESLAQEAVLAGFIPVIMGLGGGVGIQGATITVASLATGQMSMTENLGKLVFREARVGVLMGLVLSLVLLGGGWLLGGQIVGIAVGVSILCVVLASALIGMLIPVALKRVGVDPAVATGPFVTLTIDTIAILLYFSIATMLLRVM
ncbi:MAG: magnesium transporter [Myxococcota bacterium]|nr:magnesium transporter [Myxococcota bacterium]